jgi:hypothetical protein
LSIIKLIASVFHHGKPRQYFSQWDAHKFAHSQLAVSQILKSVKHNFYRSTLYEVKEQPTSIYLLSQSLEKEGGLF